MISYYRYWSTPFVLCLCHPTPLTLGPKMHYSPLTTLFFHTSLCVQSIRAYLSVRFCVCVCVPSIISLRSYFSICYAVLCVLLVCFSGCFFVLYCLSFFGGGVSLCSLFCVLFVLVFNFLCCGVFLWGGMYCLDFNLWCLKQASWHYLQVRLNL